MEEITDKLIELKPKTIIIALIFLFSLTTPLIISGALIYFEFRIMQTEITSLKESIDIQLKTITELHAKDHENTNNRIDKKTGRNEDKIKELEKPNSDKN